MESLEQPKPYTSQDVVFIFGKIIFDIPIPKPIKDEIDKMVSVNSKIVIGDAPGADTRVQDYLSAIGYGNVTVYTTDDIVRHNVGGWDVERVSWDTQLTTEREIRAQKDIAMARIATRGFAISPYDDRLDSATSLNIMQLYTSKKDVLIYDYKTNNTYTAEMVIL